MIYYFILRNAKWGVFFSRHSCAMPNFGVYMTKKIDPFAHALQGGGGGGGWLVLIMHFRPLFTKIPHPVFFFFTAFPNPVVCLQNTDIEKDCSKS